MTDDGPDRIKVTSDWDVEWALRLRRFVFSHFFMLVFFVAVGYLTVTSVESRLSAGTSRKAVADFIASDATLRAQLGEQAKVNAAFYKGLETCGSVACFKAFIRSAEMTQTAAAERDAALAARWQKFARLANP